MKFSAIAFGVAALFTATAVAAPGTQVEVREVDVNSIHEVAAILARDDLRKRNCTNCVGGIITCCTGIGGCYSISC